MLPPEPMEPKYPEPDNLQDPEKSELLTPKERAEQQAQQALQLPDAFLPHVAAAAPPDYYGQHPQPMHMQQPGAPVYPPHEAFGGAMQQLGAHMPVPYQYPSMGEPGLQHHLPPQTLPGPAGLPGGVGYPAAPPQV